MAADLLTAEHGLKFLLETITDLALIPSLIVVAERGRHFEFFIGLFQFLCSTCYNVCDALDISLFLSRRDWHELTNVLTITYGLHLAIFLMGNRSESRDHFLRYIAFACVWICQLRDGFWMIRSQYTVYAILGFMALPVINMLFGRYVPSYDRPKVLRGFVALMVAAGLFYLSLDDQHDPYRMFHGFSQVAVGAALFYLWQAVPEDQYKKHDTPLPRAYFRLD
eukprot:TRINITY_DN4344_c0_g1_i2.p1 TRINITY_DN4344_c0_g1~~TRINITY_DN4344_c0_g1_i2.p1  ORF type:complete len:223 (+),score=20.01 TRINITY_DN4344_c0_g1_i2:121-789(+)